MIMYRDAFRPSRPSYETSEREKIDKNPPVVEEKVIEKSEQKHEAILPPRDLEPKDISPDTDAASSITMSDQDATSPRGDIAPVDSMVTDVTEKSYMDSTIVDSKPVDESRGDDVNVDTEIEEHGSVKVKDEVEKIESRVRDHPDGGSPSPNDEDQTVTSNNAEDELAEPSKAVEQILSKVDDHVDAKSEVPSDLAVKSEETETPESNKEIVQKHVKIEEPNDKANDETNLEENKMVVSSNEQSDKDSIQSEKLDQKTDDTLPTQKANNDVINSISASENETIPTENIHDYAHENQKLTEGQPLESKDDPVESNVSGNGEQTQTNDKTEDEAMSKKPESQADGHKDLKADPNQEVLSDVDKNETSMSKEVTDIQHSRPVAEDEIDQNTDECSSMTRSDVTSGKVSQDASETEKTLDFPKQEQQNAPVDVTEKTEDKILESVVPSEVIEKEDTTDSAVVEDSPTKEMPEPLISELSPNHKSSEHVITGTVNQTSTKETIDEGSKNENDTVEISLDQQSSELTINANDVIDSKDDMDKDKIDISSDKEPSPLSKDEDGNEMEKIEVMEKDTSDDGKDTRTKTEKTEDIQNESVQERIHDDSINKKLPVEIAEIEQDDKDNKEDDANQLTMEKPELDKSVLMQDKAVDLAKGNAIITKDNDEHNDKTIEHTIKLEDDNATSASTESVSQSDVSKDIKSVDTAHARENESQDLKQSDPVESETSDPVINEVQVNESFTTSAADKTENDTRENEMESNKQESEETKGSNNLKQIESDNEQIVERSSDLKAVTENDNDKPEIDTETSKNAVTNLPDNENENLHPIKDEKNSTDSAPETGVTDKDTSDEHKVNGFSKETTPADTTENETIDIQKIEKLLNGEGMFESLNIVADMECLCLHEMLSSLPTRCLLCFHLRLCIEFINKKKDLCSMEFAYSIAM